MSDDDDLDDVNRRTVPSHVAESLLNQSLAADDVPAPLTDVERLLTALRAPGSPAELSGTDEVVAVFQAARQAPATVVPMAPVAGRRRHRTAKVVGIAAIATLSLSAAAAAATGRLPVVQDGRPADQTTAAPASAAASTTAAAVPADATTSVPPTTVTVPTSSIPSAVGAAATPVGPDPTGEAHDGLCTAYLAQSDQPGRRLESVAFQNLTEAATAAGQTVEEFCADVAATTTTEPNPSSTAPGESPSATAPGKTGDTPGATAPGQSGDDPGATAPGQAEATPPSVAPGPPDSTPTGPPAEVPGETAPGKTGVTPGETAPGATAGDATPENAGRPTG